MELPNSLKDKTTGWQKAVALGLMVGTGWLLVTALAAALPTILLAAQSLFWLGVMVLVFGLPAGYAITNPLAVWGFFKTLSWNFTKALIKMDPLSVMDRYVEYLIKKLKKLMASIDVLTGKKEKGNRELAALTASYEKHMRDAQAAYNLGNTSVASTESLKAQTDKGRIERLRPIVQKTELSLKLLQDLEEASKTTIERLTYQIQSKREEYELNKELYKGLKSAEDFISSDNDAAKMYGQSVLELEEQTTQFIGYIEGFERRSKAVLEGIAVEKQAAIDEGLTELQSYMAGNNLVLPSFSTSTVLKGSRELVPAKTSGKFKF